VLAYLKPIAASLSRALAVAGLLLLLAFAAATMADGLMRWLLRHPIDAVRDVGGLVVAVAVACCLPVSFLLRGHIGMRFIDTVFGRRVGGWFDVAAAVLVAGVLLLFAWQFFVFAAKAAQAHDGTWLLNVPLAPFWFAVAALLWCAAFVQVVVAADEIARVRFGATADPVR
jgi:TRAP-type C4-dicarboxylate transport system permease small subunit